MGEYPPVTPEFIAAVSAYPHYAKSEHDWDLSEMENASERPTEDD